MCFKTASLPAPDEKKAKVFYTQHGAAKYAVAAYSTRTVRLSIGESSDIAVERPTGAHEQVFSPADLRNFAAALNSLAYQLEA